MPPSVAQFAIDLDQSVDFARLSGDFNPLHIDPALARRTAFGGTVIHGIHALLKSLDVLDGDFAPEGFEPVAIACTFHNPVRTGAPVRVTATRDDASGRLRVVAEAEERLAFAATIEVRRAAATPLDAIVDAEFERGSPRIEGQPAPEHEGTVPLQLSSAHLAHLFPGLARRSASDWIANLAATTHIVGMECPGMHSIFSGIKLWRSEAPAGRATGRMRYTVQKSNPRLRLVRLGISSGTFEGTIEAFVRPRAVEQMSLAEVSRRVADGAFSGQRALVIGGSRGIGEATAKILIAGGADVTITYATGRDDADRIVAEAATLGLRCNATQLDVASCVDGEAAGWLAETHFSHVYFFASPPIARNTGRWSDELFERFCHVYVRAFDSVADVILAGARRRQQSAARFLFPSTVFLDQPENGFAEYCAAKAAGEALCACLQHKHRTQFARPRLPRMRTDQTSGVAESATADTFAVMQPLLLDLHAQLPESGV